MNYTIKHNNNILNGVELDSPLEVLNVFFHSFSKKQLFDLMICLINNEGYIGDPKGVILYHELDTEDFATGNTFKRGEVKVYQHYFGEVIINQEFFIKVCLDYLSKVEEPDNDKYYSILEKFRSISN